MSKTIPLLPCPLCGGAAEIIQPMSGRRRPWNVSCKRWEHCGLILYGGMGESRRVMTLRWNTRIAAKAAEGE